MPVCFNLNKKLKKGQVRADEKKSSRMGKVKRRVPLKETYISRNASNQYIYRQTISGPKGIEMISINARFSSLARVIFPDSSRIESSRFQIEFLTFTRHIKSKNKKKPQSFDPLTRLLTRIGAFYRG